VPVTAAEAAALDAVDRAALVETISELVAIPSVGGSAAESEAQHWYAARLAELGLDVDVWPIDLAEVSQAPGFPGMEVERSEAWGVVGYWGAEAPTLVLNGHIDVVPPGDRARWSGDPFAPAVDETSIRGRGACDMKAGLACNLHAVAAIRRARLDPGVRIAVQSVVGEEDGGLGTFATLRRGHGGDAAVITEPTCRAVIPANAGALTFRLRVAGRASHASMRLAGVSAVEKFRLLWDALVKLEASRNREADPLMAHLDLPYPLSIGTLRAGDWPSSVPDSLVAQGRLGVRLGEDPADARRALERAVAAACAADPWLAEHPASVEWYGGQFASGRLADGHPLLTLVAGAHRTVTREPADVCGAPYGSDLRLLTAAGVPTVQYGPGDVRHAHAADEHVPIDDVVRVTEVLILTILRFARQAGTVGVDSRRTKTS
jgi:acetylornithine deacetylase